MPVGRLQEEIKFTNKPASPEIDVWDMLNKTSDAILAQMWEDKSVYEFVKARIFDEEITKLKQSTFGGSFVPESFPHLKDKNGVIIDANHPDVAANAKARFFYEAKSLFPKSSSSPIDIPATPRHTPYDSPASSGTISVHAQFHPPSGPEKKHFCFSVAASGNGSPSSALQPVSYLMPDVCFKCKSHCEKNTMMAADFGDHGTQFVCDSCFCK